VALVYRNDKAYAYAASISKIDCGNNVIVVKIVVNARGANMVA